MAVQPLGVGCEHPEWAGQWYSQAAGCQSEVTGYMKHCERPWKPVNPVEACACQEAWMVLLINVALTVPETRQGLSEF